MRRVPSFLAASLRAISLRHLPGPRFAVVIASIVACHSALAVMVLDNTFDPGTTSGMQILRRTLSPTSWYATPITTDGLEYKLNSIAADIEDFGAPLGLFLEIWSVSGATGGPLSSLGRLQLVDANFPKLFETNLLTGGITLSANTSYYVVTGVDNGGGSYREEVNFGDPLGPYFAVESGSWLLQTDLPGSTLQKSFHSTTLGSNWQEDGLLAAPARMVIDATVVPEPSTWGLLAFAGLILCVRALRSRA